MNTESKSNSEIIAEALVQIIENQMKLKKHFGIVEDTGYYGDCYSDHQVIEGLRSIE